MEPEKGLAYLQVHLVREHIDIFSLHFQMISNVFSAYSEKLS